MALYTITLLDSNLYACIILTLPVKCISLMIHAVYIQEYMYKVTSYLHAIYSVTTNNNIIEHVYIYIKDRFYYV